MKILPVYKARVPDYWLKDAGTPADPEHDDVPHHYAGNFPSYITDAAPTPEPPVPATGATEVPGGEGTFTPAGADLPANLAAMAGISASPATGWVEGSFMTLGDASICHWDDAAWIVGAVPAPAPIVATGATEVVGLEGSFTPAGAVVPANLAELSATPVVASPATAWTTASFVTTADASMAHWNGTAWVVGAAPVIAAGNGEDCDPVN